ncbi:MAG TPA: hypothetical protein VIK45_18045 [Candidatus Dormibacteraeota bacterium]
MPGATILIGALVLLVTVAAFSSIRIAGEYRQGLHPGLAGSPCSGSQAS